MAMTPEQRSEAARKANRTRKQKCWCGETRKNCICPEGFSPALIGAALQPVMDWEKYKAAYIEATK